MNKRKYIGRNKSSRRAGCRRRERRKHQVFIRVWPLQEGASLGKSHQKGQVSWNGIETSNTPRPARIGSLENNQACSTTGHSVVRGDQNTRLTARVVIPTKLVDEFKREYFATVLSVTRILGRADY